MSHNPLLQRFDLGLGNDVARSQPAKDVEVGAVANDEEYAVHRQGLAPGYLERLQFLERRMAFAIAPTLGGS